MLECISGFVTAAILIVVGAMIFDLGQQTQLTSIEAECTQRGSFVIEDVIYSCERKEKE